MSIGFTLDPRMLLDFWHRMARLGDVTPPLRSSLPHPFSDHAQQGVVGVVVQDNREFYSRYDTGIQAGSAVATSAFQTVTMSAAAVADMAGALLTENPGKSVVGITIDTLNMVFSLGTRSAKMTTQGVEGESIFDQTFAVANLTTELLLAAEGIKGLGRGVASAGRHLNAAADALAKTMDRHLSPAPAAALVEGGLMMAMEDGPIMPARTAPTTGLAKSIGAVIEAELDPAAQSRKAALDEALQVPVPSMRVTALTGTLEILVQACDWDDFVYAVGHAFDAAVEIGDRKKALSLRQELAGEIARLMPDEANQMPGPQVRGQLKVLVERELSDAGRNAHLHHALQAVQDKLAGWERVARERTPDTPLPSTLHMAAQQSGASYVSRRGFLAMIGLAGIAVTGGLYAYSKMEDHSPEDYPKDSPKDFKAIGPCPNGFAYISAGSFRMGSSSDNEDEHPVHKVELDAYCMARTETTNQAYWDVMGKSRSPVNFDSPQQPVVNVNWHEAQNYCQKIGGSLPTEAQWEKAAKGPVGHPYGTHSGTLNKKEANYESEETVVVGSYLSNGYALHDMTGNVWEWSQDWYLRDAYDSHSPKNPTGPDGGQLKVMRGGSWANVLGGLRAAFRSYITPDYRSNDAGFRCVVAPQDSKK